MHRVERYETPRTRRGQRTEAAEIMVLNSVGPSSTAILEEGIVEKHADKGVEARRGKLDGEKGWLK